MENQKIILLVEMEDEPIHTNDHPECVDLECPCHEVQA